LKFLESRTADFILEPDTYGTHWSNFGSFKNLIEAGKNEVDKKIKNLTYIYKNNENKE
jgi:hypothetical protein